MNNASYEQGEATRNKIVESIKNYQKKKGYSPSVRDIQKETGIKSKSTIHNQLKILEESGRITREKGSSRTLKVVEGKKTNADCIRSMSNEELAEFLCKVKSDYQWLDHEFPSEEECGEWKEWLQSEVEE